MSSPSMLFWLDDPDFNITQPKMNCRVTTATLLSRDFYGSMLAYPILEYSPHAVAFQYTLPRHRVQWPPTTREIALGNARVCGRISLFAGRKPLCYALLVLRRLNKTSAAACSVQSMVRAMCPYADARDVADFVKRDKHGVAPWLELARQVGIVACPTRSLATVTSYQIVLAQTTDNRRVFLVVDATNHIASIMSASSFRAVHTHLVRTVLEWKTGTSSAYVVFPATNTRWLVVARALCGNAL